MVAPPSVVYWRLCYLLCDNQTNLYFKKKSRQSGITIVSWKWLWVSAVNEGMCVMDGSRSYNNVNTCTSMNIKGSSHKFVK